MLTLSMIIFKDLKEAHWPTIFVEVIILQARRDDFIFKDIPPSPYRCRESSRNRSNCWFIELSGNHTEASIYGVNI
jgi:hypothetical protein